MGDAQFSIHSFSSGQGQAAQQKCSRCPRTFLKGEGFSRELLLQQGIQTPTGVVASGIMAWTKVELCGQCCHEVDLLVSDRIWHEIEGALIERNNRK